MADGNRRSQRILLTVPKTVFLRARLSGLNRTTGRKALMATRQVARVSRFTEAYADIADQKYPGDLRAGRMRS